IPKDRDGLRSKNSGSRLAVDRILCLPRDENGDEGLGQSYCCNQSEGFGAGYTRRQNPSHSRPDCGKNPDENRGIGMDQISAKKPWSDLKRCWAFFGSYRLEGGQE